MGCPICSSIVTQKKLRKKNNKDKKLWLKLLLQHKPNKLLSKMKIGEAKLPTGPLKLLLQWVEVLPNGVDHPTGTKFQCQGSRQEKKKILINFVKHLKRIFFSTSAKNK